MKAFIACMLLCTITYGQDLVKPNLAPERNVQDTYHDITLDDPYRYMEDLENQEVVQWMKDNTNYAEGVMDNISGKQALFDTMLEMFSRRAASISNVSITDDDVYFFVKRQPGEEIGKVYKRMGYEGEDELFFDPQSYNTDSGAVYTVGSIIPNHAGTTIAISVAPGGSENDEVLFFSADGTRLEDMVTLASSVSWLESDDAFFYNKLNSADLKDQNRQLATKVYIHKMGTDETEDVEFFSKVTNPELGIQDMQIPLSFYFRSSKKIVSAVVSVDKRLTSYTTKGGTAGKKDWSQLTTEEDMVVDLGGDQNHMYFLSFKEASNYRILRSSLDNPSFQNAEVVVPEYQDEIINSMTISQDGLYYTTMKNGVEAKVYFLKNGSTAPIELDLPFAAGYAGVQVKGAEFSDVWISIGGWTSPNTRYRYNAAANTFSLEPLSTPVEYPELENLEAREVMITSHDGVEVPVSLIYNKNIKKDGSNDAVIYGYGSYGITIEPFFSPILLAYTTKGGMFVVPHVRGSGALGDAWHRAGQKLNKPNTWKDAIASAEYLINEGYTSKEKLSIMGGSAGGIFVGRSITERPDLFNAAAPMVGAMNTVRMEFTPNGPVNAPEFGTIKDADEFKGLLAMDSYHHIESGTDYPAMFISSGFNDPRVVAWQPAKFAAKAQRAHTGEDPILLMTNFDQGHGGRTTLTNSLNEFANVFSFFYWQADHPDFQPKQVIKDE